LAPEQTLPLVFEPLRDDVDLIAWVASRRAELEARLLHHGGILWRGFWVRGGGAGGRGFFSPPRGAPGYTYRSTPRTAVQGKVYTSTEYPAQQSIPMHNEMSYSRRWPRKIWFYSLEVASEGGATPIADSREVYRRIDPGMREKFERLGVTYVRNYD